MAKILPAQIKEVKAQGFLINRGTEEFSGRILPSGCVFSAEDLITIAEIANRYGNGKVAFTTRLTAEVVGIPYEQIENAKAYAAEHGLYFGGTGSKIRPITACKGTTCVYGNFDTQALAKEIHEKYYKGWHDVNLPHKFKIAVGGCPNSCMKPSLNDFGIEGHKAPDYNMEACKGCKVCNIEKSCPMKACKLIDGKMRIDTRICLTCGVCSGKCPFNAVKRHDKVQYQIYLGGTWGKKTRVGTPLSRLVSEEEISPLLEKTILWYIENGNSKERLGAVIDRIGVENMEQSLFCEDLLNRKEDILGK
ncbi:(4Fe-4S)-binding protein [Anaerosacchariphilus polymeriproducens]|uniref:(4Fe-4S)-binding protein n=1 Tax=Anaerosacchariphilus polymeriproducens TaxID=1812858 RepID=A0A371AV32_9FIRM|nr:(4Fe-4S)-binding protein [Anaerosacchariphilus polymeriproducens]RDU23428.1 (4Fe-4S)-binding protein [Anaerosacchariphilus polymeriproducens]